MNRCQTFTHHVGAKIRVECVHCPKWVRDVEPTPKGQEPTSRQIATTLQREHEGES